MNDLPATAPGPCAVHRTHVPRPLYSDVHHVWPIGHHGPDVPANRVLVCQTGHARIHRLLDAWLRVGGDPGWSVRRAYHPVERRLARLGFERITRGAL